MERQIRLVAVNDFAEWRAVARGLLMQGIEPTAVDWVDPAQPQDMLDRAFDRAERIESRQVGRVPPRFIRLAQIGICHRDPARFALLYRLLWRLQKDRRVLFNLDDTDVGKLNRRVDAVVAEFERMTRELRFRRSVAADGHKGLAAWFAPQHYVVEHVAPHFTRVVADEDWVIRTPYRSAFWDRKTLRFGDGRARG